MECRKGASFELAHGAILTNVEGDLPLMQSEPEKHREILA